MCQPILGLDKKNDLALFFRVFIKHSFFAPARIWRTSLIFDPQRNALLNLLVFPSSSCYISCMEPEFIFVPSVFKHGVTKEDIHHAYKTKIYDGPLRDYVSKHGFVGFNRAGNPIEVFYNPIDDDIVKVFHAMGCRDGTIDQLR